MTDFIRYVVNELKSKRLTKEHARTILEQFAQGSGSGKPAAQLHPLLHANTSDLNEQRYCSWFDGGEFFLADHQVRLGDASRKVLPAVAYLEMARSAISLALPPEEGQTLELRQTVWAQPVIVDARRQVSIVLQAADDGSVEYEILSLGADGEETVHCQGRGVYTRESAPQPLALDQLEGQMKGGDLGAQELYGLLWSMGLEYGVAHRAVDSLSRGDSQALVHLHVPAEVESSSQDYVLHPSLMDGALQACIGLLAPQDGASRTLLPYSVESVRVVRPCVRRMRAWVREARGSSAALRKLDLDLCDEQGAVCVQMRGFTARAVDSAALASAPAQDLVWAVPQWQERAAPAQTGFNGKRHVWLCGLEQVAPAALADLLPGSQCAVLGERYAAGGLAERYTAQAVNLFEQVQSLLRDGLHSQELLQLVVADSGEQALWAGLSGLLRTAALENPQLRAQLVLVDGATSAADLAALLQSEPGAPSLVRYRDGRRAVQAWEQRTWQGAQWPVAFRDDGVYLITGGLGGLGQIFAAEILSRAPGAQVVLTGRSALAKPLAERTAYRQVDLEDAAAVQAMVDEVVATYGRLDGIVHSAGQVADELILKKSSETFAKVIGPKVAGTVNLDLATRGVALDFLVLFSSIASAMGNIGQADYASGNGFMDQYAAYRNALAAAGERHGRTVAINWPLWQDGGMKMEADSRAWMQRSFGVSPLQNAAGLQALNGALSQDGAQAMVIQGEKDRIALLLSGLAPDAPLQAATQAKPAQSAVRANGTELQEQTEDFLRRQLAGVLRMPASRIDARAPLETYGIDSVVAMRITRELERTFGSLSKTLLFEYQTLSALAGYFVREHSAKVGTLFAAASPAEAVQQPAPETQAIELAKPLRRKLSRRRASEPVAARNDEPIAIIGMSGRYPLARDLDAFWQNLRDGRDCVTEVPADRWDWREYYSADRTEEGRHYSKWGGFIEGVDQFDPLFFNISPREARNIDPQERLFLQQTWMAIEDAGYTRAALQERGQVGVYAGVMYSEYQLYGAQAAVLGQSLPLVGSLASVANRVSYALNLHGPSMTLDTMCSSSLTAIHIACQDLKLGRTDMALAGGVNVTVHPHKYHILSAGQFISSDGHCQSFGEGGDGYIPGEGVGVVVLKRLSDAQRDGDRICGVILGSALNHGGKTNGYTVPNPQAQSSAIGQALAEAKIDARHISYVEAHGTGTKLGDPIEIAALGKAFGQYTQERGFCRIGSAKSNIGHCESAAGIAGLMKVLLQMRHGEIVPSLHSSKLNPHIDFGQTPFVVNQALTAWERPVIDGREVGRIAGLSSFGAGGSNAHMIIQEYRQPEQAIAASGPAAIVLSARTAPQLRQKAADLLAYLERGECADLQAIAYTLQTGREAMDERLGIMASDIGHLAGRLRAFIGGEQEGEDLYRGVAKRSQDGMSLISQDDDMKEAVGKWIVRRKYGKLLELWAKGLDVDWQQLYGQSKPARVSLPTYPFAEERYWIEMVAPQERSAATAQLHPLLHANTSDLSEQSYSSVFDGTEFFLADHQVRLGDANRKVLPAVAYLEMARAAIALALPAEAGQTLELRQTVWAQPVIVDGKRQVSIALMAADDGSVEFEVFSTGENGEDTVHCQGVGVYVGKDGHKPVALQELEAEMGSGVLEAGELYGQLAGMGLEYGPAHRAVTGVVRGEGQILARLQLPAAVRKSAQAFLLHPSLLDGALQACASMLAEGASGTVLPYAVESVRVIQPCAQGMLAWVREASGSSAALRKLDIDLCDEQGAVCVQLRGFTARAVDGAALASAPAQDLVWAVPQWQERAVAEPAGFTGKRHVWLCGLEQVAPAALADLLPGSQCAALGARDAAGGLAERYTSQAVNLFEQVQSLLRNGLHSQELLQLVVADNGEQALWAGLSGLLRTAALENPQLRAQLVLVDGATSAAELAALLQSEPGAPSLVRYRDGRRAVQAWEQRAWQGAQWPVAFRDDGVYLITGGLGGLGQIFAAEILQRTERAQVVLTGRSALAKALPERTAYRQVDLEETAAVQAMVDELVATYGRLDGIVHSAGQVADEFILNKTPATFARVLAPKVAGTVNLDLATRGVALDFLVLFSSIASAMGNVGQADYASGNGFMDQYAAYRNALAAAGERHGRTVAVNWPLWQEGGMKMEADSLAWMQRSLGVTPLRSAAGVQALHGALAEQAPQVLLLQGDRERIGKLLTDAAPQPAGQNTQAPERQDGSQLTEQVEEFLRRQLANVLQMPSSRVDVQAPLEHYGIDSVLAMTITRELEKTFGALSKTLLFEFQTLAALARYLQQHHAAKVAELFATPQSTQAIAAMPPAQSAKPVAVTGRKRARRKQSQGAAAGRQGEPIAIIGMSGRYPLARDLDAYWQNLRDGRDCVTEVPADRWNWRDYFSADRTEEGRHYSKWGGFIEGVDQFDPLFFNISPREARNIDPQERLFLQQTWMAIEDAGYTRASLQGASGGGQVGVYAGVMYTEYQLYGAQAELNGQHIPVGSSLASVANRVSYALNLHGPSMTLDTMCSSSLTAIHIACQDLKLGRTDMALAGGINVTVHPRKYYMLSAGQFISSDGHCQSFGEGGDGYIPGEGVGVVVLKRLSDARRDGDRICGVILGSALNHGGKTNGYTVPNPQAQSSAIGQALAEAKIDARHISYVEAHGTGTKLGDPIEIAALGKAFGQYTQERGFCRIGSAKSNIGHCESAAGIAGLMKVLLQMRHGEIVPSLHSSKLNPHIDFGQTPFVVNQALTAWERPVIDGREVGRIAGLSSFGAGGSNAHMIIQEYRQPEQACVASGPAAIVLSARTAPQLRQKAADLLAYLERGECADLQAIAYTLQTGREAMDERLGIMASDLDHLAGRLRAFIGGEQEGEDLYRGVAKRSQDGMNLISQDEDMKEAVGKWIARRKYGKLLELWAKGLDVDWQQLYGTARPQRVSLPTYPFAEERYWIEMVAPQDRSAATAQLHPLLHANTSDLSEQSYSSVFDGTEFFLADHQVRLGDANRKVLPAVAYLEMARAAIALALPAEAGQTLELRQTVWAQPVIVDGKRQVSIALMAADDGSVEFEVFSTGENGEDTVHCQGVGVYVAKEGQKPVALQELEAEMGSGVLEAGELYGQLAGMGLEYGPAHRAVTGVVRGEGQILARLQLPAAVRKSAQAFVLHPSLLDGALQACASMLAEGASGTVLPYAVESVRVIQPCAQGMLAWVREASGSSAALRKLDIDLCDEQGAVCVQLRGFTARAVDGAALAPAQDLVWAVPQWQERAVAEAAGFSGKRHVWLCGLEQVVPAALADLLPDSQCAALGARDTAAGLAERYTLQAVNLFEQVQSLLRNGLHSQELLQLVVADNGEQALWAGLSGLLRTAALENPQLRTQLVLVDGATSAADLAALLQSEPGAPSLVRYRDGRRAVQAWEQRAWQGAQWPVAFRDDGVYLITGGLGGLGQIFAAEILQRTERAQVVLTGRSALAKPLPERTAYRQLDLENAAAVQAMVDEVVATYGRLDGVVHSAGQVADEFMLNKTPATFARVLAPKVAGTVNLDLATRGVALDFLVLFSSIASAMGNVGQADYASGNGFMDQYAAYRNTLAAAGERHGRTVAVNWPLWQEGGMKMEADSLAWMQRSLGVTPLRSAAGVQALYGALAQDGAQALVLQGDRQRIVETLEGTVRKPAAEPASDPDSQDVRQSETRMEDFLRRQLAGVLQMPSSRIDVQAPLENYGIDSVLAMSITRELEKTFGTLSKTLLFEYQTLAALARYLNKAFPQALRGEMASEGAAREVQGTVPAQAPAKRATGRRARATSHAAPLAEVAIVGVSGQYPQAADLDAYWANLKDGKDCIVEIPAERWENSAYFDADKAKAGKIYGKWGGFLNDVDCFDPLFFGISPKEAQRIDPQERLFLQTTWKAVEDAGYSRQSLAGRRIGVYVGVMWAQYELLSVEARLNGGTDVAGSSHASIANRVSYLFDWHGPSIALDTMCSSSLTAIHLACEAIRSGEIEAAVAGGVNVSIHPQKYLGLSQGSFLSTDGRCRSFGEGGDGYVPGEGVGALMLKRLDAAQRDGDHVYAVIRANGVNHGGKTNGYSVPNPQAQGELIREVLQRGAVAPETVNYVEAHGTGTALGDPIEIKGLLSAFGDAAEGRVPCPIGSVKSNIGHLEAAAGVAAVTKVLLQMKHRQLVPSLHALPANPHIDFAATPFRVQSELTPWTPPAMQKRRACISSFGAGGSNAHLVLDEYQAAGHSGLQAAEGSQLFLLSARDGEALRNYARAMLGFLDSDVPATLADIAYTSQVGRVALAVRLAIVADSRAELRQRLQDWLAAQESPAEGVFHGDTKALRNQLGDLISGGAGESLASELLARRDLQRAAQLWTLGMEIDWSKLPRQTAPQRVSLPTYPFARQRFWIDTGTAVVAAARQDSREQVSYYRPQWTVQPLAKAGSREGDILLLGAAPALAEALGGHAVIVQWGPEYCQKAADTFVVNPASEEDFKRMVEALRAEQRLPSRIVHVCALDGAGDAHALLSLWKAYISSQRPGKVRLLTVHAASAAAVNPYGAAMAGMLRALAMEEPALLASTLELDGIDTAKAALVIDELGAAGGSAVRYEQSDKELRRMVRTLDRWQPESPKGKPPVRQRGVYLITGGLGGLGLMFARYLAQACQANLVLTGRGEPGARQQAQIDELTALGAQVRYVRGDVANLADIEAAVQTAKREFGVLHGVIHSAGVTRDALALNKTAGQMAQVLAPKLDGTVNLDLATRDEPLDWFVMFSSVAAQIGNVGQCDYAYGNHFMDSFAERREGMRACGQRSGQTLSINWPLWREGGMQVAEADLVRMERATGMTPLPTGAGLHSWEALLAGGCVQGMVLHGDAARIEAALRRTAAPAAPAATVRKTSPLPAAQVGAGLAQLTRRYLQDVVGEESKLPADCIDIHERFEAYGFDSVMVARVTARLERDLGQLPKTLLFEHETIDELAQHLLATVQPALAAMLDAKADVVEVEAPAVPVVVEPAVAPVPAALPPSASEPIAIIGVHGLLPGSADLDEFWRQLQQGQDMIDLVPASRWDYRDFDPAHAKVPEQGAIYCKWGAFLDDYDKFDPAFFNMSAEEARAIDPQERLFLQSVWSALEDAGYTREALRERHPKGKGASVGVYVGVTTNTYHLCAAGAGDHATPAVLPWSIANRVSYFFDFEGPSMPVDTACSSSLVALHLACESLRHGECQVAVAGGVNLYLHPSKYQSLCSRHMVSTDGRCRSYGADGDGFVPGEGVGSLILKPLRKAIADGDQVYAVIRASAYAHSGRSNGYSAPNPNAQAGLIEQVLEQAGVHPESISYVEGHGTGTPLGDGIEMTALTKAFRRQSSRTGFCAVGSVKANIGHGESVAGIAGVTKVLLQMKHRMLAPTIHADVANPNIDFDASPFFLQRVAAPWQPEGTPRRALVNSFGAGGVNACVVLEEYSQPGSRRSPAAGEVLLPLSARNEEALRRNAQQLVSWLRRTPHANLAEVCHAMQVGREAMEERLAVVADSHQALLARLEAWLAGDKAGVLHGRVDKRRAGAKRQPQLPAQGAPEGLSGLAQAWVQGGSIDWSTLYGGEPPARISVPSYSFEKQRYWITDGVPAVPQAEVQRDTPASAALHPLVSHNASTLRQTSFISHLQASAFHAVDHRVNQRPIFPGAGYLEIAAACGALAAEQQVLKLRDIVWAHPLGFEDGAQMLRTVLKPAGDGIEFSISSLGADQERVVHSEGRIELCQRSRQPAGGGDVAIAAIVQECASRFTGEHFYGQMRRHGLDYGPSFQVIQEVHVGATCALARMALPEALRAGFGDYTLHPSLVDGALQSVAVLLAGAGGPCLPFALDEIEIVRPLGYACYALAEYAEPSGRGQLEVQKMNIRLFNERGELLVKFSNLYVRRLAAAAGAGESQLKDAA